MSTTYLIALMVAVAVAIYLLVILFHPEDFS
ncbi:MAG: potassium-transporting ATPase subunit F [Dokdonella sp.]|nr:MAG: potassium-transporting ATPase subunit F [Dokdonella sp.]